MEIKRESSSNDITQYPDDDSQRIGMFGFIGRPYSVAPLLQDVVCLSVCDVLY